MHADQVHSVNGAHDAPIPEQQEKQPDFSETKA